MNSFRQAPGGGADWISFPQYFKQHGYVTLGTGKTFHPGLPPNFDEPKSWSQDEPYFFAGNAYPKCKEWPKSLACPNADPLDTFSDYNNMQKTKEQIQKYGHKDKPFFLAFGAHRPHLPWNIPTKYWDMYAPTDNITLPLHQSAPVGMPPIAFTYECDGKTKLTCFERTEKIPYPNANTSLTPNVTRSFRRAYYAAVTFTDSLIGELLDTLEGEGLANNTIVALIGDHGWQLGEHNIWGKHTNFELGTRVPIIVSAPDKIRGMTSNQLIESVDLYPTLAALAGLPAPPDLDGVDLSALFTDPDPPTPIKQAVFSEYPRCPHNIATPWDDTTSCIRTDRTKFTSMGYSVRTDDYRYTAWLHWDGQRLQGDFGRPPIGQELYTHEGDDESNFDLAENMNLVNDPNHQDVVHRLYQLAVTHWNKTTVISPGVSPGVSPTPAHIPLDPVMKRLQFEDW